MGLISLVYASAATQPSNDSALAMPLRKSRSIDLRRRLSTVQERRSRSTFREMTR